jgi:hypothetical protein
VGGTDTPSQLGNTASKAKRQKNANSLRKHSKDTARLHGIFPDTKAGLGLVERIWYGIYEGPFMANLFSKGENWMVRNSVVWRPIANAQYR